MQLLLRKSHGQPVQTRPIYSLGQEWARDGTVPRKFVLVPLVRFSFRRIPGQRDPPGTERDYCPEMPGFIVPQNLDQRFRSPGPILQLFRDLCSLAKTEKIPVKYFLIGQNFERSAFLAECQSRIHFMLQVDFLILLSISLYLCVRSNKVV